MTGILSRIVPSFRGNPITSDGPGGGSASEKSDGVESPRAYRIILGDGPPPEGAWVIPKGTRLTIIA